MNPPLLKRRYVMLDRDGTVISDRHYLSDPDQVELLPGAVEGLQRLRQLGLGLVLITNQSGIGRGYFSLARLDAVHQRLKDLLAVHEVFLDGIYVCPHTPADLCICRKPRPGLVYAAATQLGFVPSEGFVIGDKPSDIELGRAVNARTFLVRTHTGAKHETEISAKPDYAVGSILEAATLIARLVPPIPMGSLGHKPNIESAS